MIPTIQHIHEPEVIRVAWQGDDSTDRLRRIVGNIYRHGDTVQLEYATDTEDFEKATESGFKGLPPFPIREQTVYSKNVLEYLEKRLPPKSRADYGVFLKYYGLPENVNLSTLGIVGYTEGQLPADWFSFIHPFDVDAPCEFVMEVAGTRHHCDADTIRALAGETVSFTEEENEHEPTGTAIRLSIGDQSIGHVNRVHLNRFRKWNRTREISGMLVRVNGTSDRPRAFVFVAVR